MKDLQLVRCVLVVWNIQEMRPIGSCLTCPRSERLELEDIHTRLTGFYPALNAVCYRRYKTKSNSSPILYEDYKNFTSAMSQ